MARDYYETLGVSRNASDREIRQAYRRLARKHHPDVNPGSGEAQERFKEVNAAYEVLSDLEKRKKYNQFGENWKYADQFTRAGAGPGGHPFFWRSTGYGTLVDQGDLGDLGSGGLFGDLLRGFGGSRRGRTATRSATVEVPVELTLEEAFAGVTRTVQTPAVAARTPKRLQVSVPPGADTGSRIHVSAGAGLELYLVVTLRPHHRFQRKGAALYVDLPLPLADAVLGSVQEVATLNGKVMLTVPQETQNGQVFRLRGQGMPRLGQAKGRGDLFATVKVVLPANLTEREKELFRELKEARSA